MNPNDNEDDDSCFVRIRDALAIGALGGGAVSLFQTSWYPDADLYGHKGAKVADPVTFSKMFRSVPIFRGPFFGTVMLCGMFASIECLLESLRGPARPSPWINSGIAGMATGAVLGLFTKRYDVMVPTSLGIGLLTGMVKYNQERDDLGLKTSRTDIEIEDVMKKLESKVWQEK